MSAYYALPEGSRGIFVGGGGSVRLPRLIGVHRMADMMLTGRVIDARSGPGSRHLAIPRGGRRGSRQGDRAGEPDRRELPSHELGGAAGAAPDRRGRPARRIVRRIADGGDQPGLRRGKIIARRVPHGPGAQGRGERGEHADDQRRRHHLPAGSNRLAHVQDRSVHGLAGGRTWPRLRRRTPISGSGRSTTSTPSGGRSGTTSVSCRRRRSGPCWGAARCPVPNGSPEHASTTPASSCVPLPGATTRSP